jgi:anti-anti-sigma factor
MLFRLKKSGALTVLIFETPHLLNGMDVEAIETALSALLDGGDQHILLDFKRVKHISSPALSMILRMHSRLGATPGGQLALCDLNPQLMEAIKITRLDRLIPLFARRTEALAWAKAKFSAEKTKVND